MDPRNPVSSFLVLFRTGLLSQILLLLTIPVILARYTPESFGVFSLMITIGTVMGVVSALKLERAIVVEEDGLLASIFTISLVLIVISSVACYLLIYLSGRVFGLSVVEYFYAPPLVSLYCCMMGLVQLFCHMAMREVRSDLIGYSDMLFSGAVFCLILLFPIGEMPVVTLLKVYVFSKLLALVPFVALDWRPYNRQLLSRYGIKSSFSLFGKYIKPVFTTLLSTMQFRGIYYLLGLYFGPAATGHVAMAHRVAYAPVNLIGTALRRAYFSEFSRLDDSVRDIRRDVRLVILVVTVAALLLMPIVKYLALYFASTLAIDWYLAIEFIIILYPAASILITLSWLDRLYDARGRQGTALLYEFIYTSVLYVVLFGVGKACDVKGFVSLYTIVTVIYNVLWADATMKLMSNDRWPVAVLGIGHLVMIAVCVGL